MSGSLLVWAPDGVPEVAPGDDLAALLTTALAAEDFALADGDVVLVTSKIVSKAEGRAVRVDREEAITAETVRVVARRGPMRIVETRHGLVMAAAGVDASDTDPGTVLLLPVDPDASARTLRSRLLDVAGVDVGVVVTDTMGRAWRTGLTDQAIGVAGLAPLDDLRGRDDGHGNVLTATVPAIADELAAAGDLVKGKLGRRPFAVVRGLAHRTLREDGPGAAAAGASRRRGHVPARDPRGGRLPTHRAVVHRRAGRPRGGTTGRRCRRHGTGAAPHDTVAVRRRRRPAAARAAARRDARRLGRRPAPRRLHRGAGRAAHPSRRRAARRAHPGRAVHGARRHARLPRREAVGVGARDVPRRHRRRRRELPRRAGGGGTRLGVGQQHDVLPRRRPPRARAARRLGPDGRRRRRPRRDPGAGPAARDPDTSSCTASDLSAVPYTARRCRSAHMARKSRPAKRGPRRAGACPDSSTNRCTR